MGANLDLPLELMAVWIDTIIRFCEIMGKLKTVKIICYVSLANDIQGVLLTIVILHGTWRVWKELAFALAFGLAFGDIVNERA